MRATKLGWAVFAVGVVLSVALTLILGRLFLFLVVPFLFIPFAARTPPAPPTRVCSKCGWTTTDPQAAYCAYDGTPFP